MSHCEDGVRTIESFLKLMGTPDAALEHMKASPYWSHMTAFADALVYDVRLCNDGKVPVERLHRISVPTLALAGGESQAWAAVVARAIAEPVQNGEARVLEGQSHGVADEVLVPILNEFFARDGIIESSGGERHSRNAPDRPVDHDGPVWCGVC